LNEDIKRNIRESLVYALQQLKSKTQIRLVIQEFYHSLNRKNLLLNHEAASEIAEAERLIDGLSDNWKFVSRI